MKKHHVHQLSNRASRRFHLIVLFSTVILIFVAIFVRRTIGDVSKFGYLGVFLVNFIASATVLFPLPGIASVFIGGAIWNPLLVAVSSGLGASLGELSGYLLGFGSRGVINHHLSDNKKFRTVEGWFEKGGFVAILLLALIPSPLFDFIGIFAGSVQYPVWKYVLATFLGRSIRNFLVAFAGAKVLPI